MAPEEQEKISLKEYFDSKIEDLKKYFNAKIEAMDNATTLARNAMDRRLEGMNEFRETLKDQASKFITRQELTALIERISEDIREFTKYKATMEGKASQSAMIITLLVATASLVIGVISLFK